ncbi:MAG: glycosyltransferase [Methanomassiliicoccaceae archaeon]|nr:glycosyltransferase [Methanomassiliicoccaceae archaeon]
MHKNSVALGTLDISTRPKRRRAVASIIRALGRIHHEEFKYMGRIPFNLQGGDAYSAADESLDYLVEAMRNVDYKLIICGKGPEGKRLEKQIEKLGLGDWIELKGWVEEDEKERLMGSCRFFVMPSLFESLGLAAIEQMAYGRPIIYSSVNGLPETIKDGGIAVPPKDPAALSKAMNSLLNDRDLTEELGRNAAKRARSYEWNELMPLIRNVYEKVLSGEYSAKDAHSSG